MMRANVRQGAAGAGAWDKERLNKFYDEAMFVEAAYDLNEHSDYYNVGLWPPGITELKVANDTLTEKLLGFMPNKTGSILDVACGKGATTRLLLKYYAPPAVTAINISKKQLEKAAENAPGCTFLEMDAAKLDFPDQSFDNLLCVEAAFHFNTREKFLREALRVLKPGGRLVLSDVLMSEQAEAKLPTRPAGNYLAGPDKYSELLRQCGFSAIHVEDQHERCTVPFYLHIIEFLTRQCREGKLKRGAYLMRAMQYLYMLHHTRHYLLVSAERGTG